MIEVKNKGKFIGDLIRAKNKAEDLLRNMTIENVESIEDEIDSLEDEIRGLEDEIRDLKDKIDELEDKKRNFEKSPHPENEEELEKEKEFFEYQIQTFNQTLRELA